MGRYDRTLRVVIWLDALLSTAVALLCVVVTPIVVTMGVPHRIVAGVGVAAIACAVLLTALGAITAIAIMLRVHSGEWAMPHDLRLPLPSHLRPGEILGPRHR